MKKLISALAILLILAMAFGLAACSNTPGGSAGPESAIEEERTEPVNMEEATTANPEGITEGPGEATTTEAPQTNPGETATAEAASDATAASASVGIADPTRLDKAGIVSWYNDRINYVREHKPQMDRVEVLKINRIETSLGNLANAIINPIVQRFMPGDPYAETKAGGQGNAGFFFTEMEKSSVRAEDVTSATAVKQGDTYVVTLTLGRETNPAKDGTSKYYRVFPILTREDVLDVLAGVVTADINKAAMWYYNGKAVITVNQKGEIIGATADFQVDVDAKEAKAAFITTDLKAYQSSSHVFSNFVYRV